MASRSAALQFRLFGFPVEVQASFWFMALLFGASGRTPLFIAGWVAIVFVSILVHELGHAFIARAFGAAPRIELYAGGGLTHHAHVDGWWRELAISIAGPFAGLALGALVWCAGSTRLREDVRVDWLIEAALWVNVWWSLLNLLPVWPYDGGQAFQAVATRFSKRGLWISSIVSIAVGGAGLAYALFEGRYWLAWLAGYGVQRSWNALKEHRIERRLDEAQDAWSNGDLPRMERAANEVLASSKDDAVRASAIQHLSWAMVARGDIEAARGKVAEMVGFTPSDTLELTLALLERRTIGPPPSSFDPKTLWVWPALVKGWIEIDRIDLARRLLAPEGARLAPRDRGLEMTALLFYADRFAESSELGQHVFAAHNHPDDAYNVACSESRRGHVDEGIAWLERAIEAGYRDHQHLVDDEDLAALRGHTAWPSLVERARNSPPP